MENIDENENENVVEPEEKETVLVGDACAMQFAYAAYAHDFETLSPQQKLAARRKAIQDYDEFECWERGNDLSKEQVQKIMQTDATVVRMSAGWSGELCKYIDGVLCGKSRWTPRGFEDVWRYTDQTNSPTVGVGSKG